MNRSYCEFEIKSTLDSGEFSGYASTFRRDLDGDRFEPGAFAASIVDRKGKIPIFLHHDRMQWAGSSTSLAEDEKGLYIEARLFLNTTPGREAWGVLKDSKAVGSNVGLSVGFIPKVEDYDQATNTRLLKEVDLWETSVTPFPANPWSRVEQVKSLRHYERLIRDVCKCSAAEAKRVLASLPLALSGAPDGEPLTPARDVRGTRQTEDYGPEILAALRSLKEIQCQ